MGEYPLDGQRLSRQFVARFTTTTGSTRIPGWWHSLTRNVASTGPPRPGRGKWTTAYRAPVGTLCGILNRQQFDGVDAEIFDDADAEIVEVVQVVRQQALEVASGSFRRLTWATGAAPAAGPRRSPVR